MAANNLSESTGCQCRSEPRHWDEGDYHCTYEQAAAAGEVAFRTEHLTCRHCGERWVYDSYSDGRFTWERVH